MRRCGTTSRLRASTLGSTRSGSRCSSSGARVPSSSTRRCIQCHICRETSAVSATLSLRRVLVASKIAATLSLVSCSRSGSSYVSATSSLSRVVVVVAPVAAVLAPLSAAVGSISSFSSASSVATVTPTYVVTAAAAAASVPRSVFVSVCLCVCGGFV